MNIDYPRLFSALSNETRLRCLHLIFRNDEVCVCEVTEALGINQPTASKALKSLKAAGVLRDRKDANWNYYRLNSDTQPGVRKIVAECCASLAKSADYAADQKRFLAADLRPD